MNKKIFSKNLWTILSVVFATVLVFMLILAEIGGQYASVINAELRVKTSKVIPGNGDYDTNYYPFDFSKDNPDGARKLVDDVVREVEGDGLVLVKNDGLKVPLKSGDTVSVFGTASVNVNASTQGTPANNDKTEYPNFKAALESDGITVNQSLWDFYKSNATYGVSRSNIKEIPWSSYTPALRETLTGTAAVVVFTRYNGEGTDVLAKGTDGAGGNYLALSAQEKELLTNITLLKKQGKFSKVILILNTALTLQLDFLDDTAIEIDTIMWVGNVGSSGIYAVADALVGKVNPSGRLSDTLLKDNFASPAAKLLQLAGNGSASLKYMGDLTGLSGTQYNYTAYVEGIYVGYRYFETRYEDYVVGTGNAGDYEYSDEVAYPFGYGLSYTEFEYSNFAVSDRKENGTYDVSVTVTNKGGKAGKHAVQVYLQKPYTTYDKKNKIEKASVELVGFKKTAALAPGASEVVTVSVEEKLFASYDSNNAATYILDEGDYYLAVGTDAHDALNNILAARGESGMTDFMGEDADGNSALADVALEQATLDIEKYSKAATGRNITNQLDSCDMNRYDGAGKNSVRYVSRSNWLSTYPTELIAFEMNDFIKEDLGNITIDDFAKKGYKRAKTAPTFGASNNLTIAGLRNTKEKKLPITDEKWQKLVEQVNYEEINRMMTTAICQTAEITTAGKPDTKDSDGPAYVKDEGNGGVDTGARLPSEGVLASTYDVALIEKLGKAFAEDAHASNVHGLYAPGANIHRTPYGGRNSEYYSEDPMLSGLIGAAETRGIQSKGVIVYVKHFAFNESDDNRDGICVWFNEQEAREIMLRAFEYITGAQYGNSHAIMTSFNRSGCTWTSANYGLITEILRGEWGFDGYVITDYYDNDVQFMRPLDGVMAGTDLWLGNAKVDFGEYKDNPTVLARMQEAAKRVLYITANYSWAMNGIDPDARIVSVVPWWQMIIYVATALFALLTVGAATMFALSEILPKRMGCGNEA